MIITTLKHECYLPKYNKEKPLYIGFFNTGAYQETIGGYGGHHCLIPQPKHILIDRDENGIWQLRFFRTTNFPRCP
jgi:arginine decarboxylase